MPKIYVTASTGNPLRSTVMQAADKERSHGMQDQCNLLSRLHCHIN